MQADRYYRHSGRFSPIAVAKALGLGLLVSVPMAFVYSYILVYLPIIGVITFLLTAGFAGVVGYAVGAVMHAGKVRNNMAAMTTAVLVGLFALWAAWVTWVYAILHRGDADVGLLDLVLQPAGLWQVITIINEKGAWSFKGSTPTGGLLWAMWGLEASLIVGIVVVVARAAVSSPFCEGCDRWCEEHKAIAMLGPIRKDALVPRLEQGDYGVLRELRDVSGSSFTQLDLHQCSQCLTTVALSATAVTFTVKKGKQQREDKALLAHLLLSPADLSTVKGILAEGPGSDVARVQVPIAAG
jgi:hypothetical protein